MNILYDERLDGPLPEVNKAELLKTLQREQGEGDEERQRRGGVRARCGGFEGGGTHGVRASRHCSRRSARW